MNSRLSSPLIDAALRMAVTAHAGQTRKGSDVPYIVHPVAVAMILARAGFQAEPVLAAALLHDVVEDTPVLAEDLQARFPESVNRIVEQLTETKRDAAGARRPWETRKREQLAVIERAGLEVRAVALADKLHNLQTMCDDSTAGRLDWSLFNASPERVLWYHDELVRAAAGEDPELVPLADECRRLIDRLRHDQPEILGRKERRSD